jgi:hypothetical protein
MKNKEDQLSSKNITLIIVLVAVITASLVHTLQYAIFDMRNILITGGIAGAVAGVTAVVLKKQSSS